MATADGTESYELQDLSTIETHRSASDHGAEQGEGGNGNLDRALTENQLSMIGMWLNRSSIR